VPKDGIAVKHFSPSATARLEKIGQLADFTQHQRVLEVGCGIGHISETLAPRVGTFIGLEVLPESVRIAKKSIGSEHAHFVVGLAEALPFRSGVFDGFVAAEVIEHLPQPEHLLHEARRVLRTGSKLLLTTPNGDLSKPFTGSMPIPSLVWFLAALTKHPKFRWPYGHRYGGITARRLRTMLQSEGFGIDRQLFCGWAITKAIDELLYTATVITRKTGEVAWTKSDAGMGFKLYRAVFPLINAFSKLDNIPLRLGLEGYITVVRATRD